MTDQEPTSKTMRAMITAVTLTYACPACAVAVDEAIDVGDGEFGFEVDLQDRFDLCSHCGQLLDFGARLTQEAA